MIDMTGLEDAVRDMYRSMAADEVLREALDEISKGWIQGALRSTAGNPDGTGVGVCLLGALNKTCTGDAMMAPIPGDRNWEAYHKAIAILSAAIWDEAQQRGYPWSHADAMSLIPSFNDVHTNTVEDVTLVLKRALENAEESEE